MFDLLTHQNRCNEEWDICPQRAQFFGQEDAHEDHLKGAQSNLSNLQQQTALKVLGLQLPTCRLVFYTEGQKVPLELWAQPPGISFSCRDSSGK